MSQPILQHDASRPVGTGGAASGADLSEGIWEMVALPRKGQPPLRFKGRRLTRHWRLLSSETQIFIELWQRRAGGVVVAYSTCSAQATLTECIRFGDLNGAIEHLESLCIGQAETLAMTGAPLVIFRDLVHRLAFNQQFSLLVGETLADWCQMPPLKKDRS